MAINTSLAPYFDDYNAEKRFYKILYNPGKAVQARELNQMQTMLQEQVARFGDHVFTEGSMVVPGSVSHNLEFPYVKIDTTFPYSVISSEGLSGRVEGQTSGVEGILVHTEDAEGSDPITIYVQYLNSGSNGEYKSFVPGETINFYNETGLLIATAEVQADGVGYGSSANIKDGIFFTNGHFVIVHNQIIVLDKYTTEPTYRVGLEYIEDIVTEATDISLLDNANGTPNESAPGAHRLRITLRLSKREVSSTDDIDFIELMRLEDGILQTKVRTPDYNVLGETLARRTYDESGDYTVEPFLLTLREHLRQGGNNGVYLSADGGDPTKFVVQLDKGKAYVRGNEIETISDTRLSIDKARDTANISGAVTNLMIGNYITVNRMNSVPRINQFTRIDLRDDVITTDGTSAGVKLGSASVKAIQYVSGDVTTANAVYRLYLFDIRNASDQPDSSFMANVKSMFRSESPVSFTANVLDATIRDANHNTMVFKLPYSRVKSLKQSGFVDSIYTVLREYNVQADSNGVVAISVSGNEAFDSYSQQNYIMSTKNNSGIEVVDLDGKVTIGGSGQTLTVNLGSSYANDNVRLICSVIKSNYSEKVKTSTNVPSFVGTPVGGRLSLNKADVYRINSITLNSTSQDVTGWFILDNGIRENYYDVSSIRLKSGYPDISSDITVNFDYFAHGTGDFFSVDSYAGIPYEDIPTMVLHGETVRVSDVIDFRPRKGDTSGLFSGTGSSIVEPPRPGTNFFVDFDYYLSRKDKVYLNYMGEFGVVRGRPALFPTEPLTPDNTMLLYVLDIPAYTFSASDVSASMVDNRRYTMRDIGRLERRIRDLEYYVSLNTLEKEATDMQIIDPVTGLNRFKNGFQVDSFSDFSVADQHDTNFSASIDTFDKVMRPRFAMQGLSLDRVTNDNNIVNHNGFITLAYTEKSLIKQDQASSTMNINPYAIFTWNGTVKLMPSIDTWVDTVYTEPEITQNTVNKSVTTSTVWNWWGINLWGISFSWSGVPTSGIPDGAVRTYDSNTKSIFQYETTTNTVVGDKIVQTGSIPFIRSKNINFRGEGLKPLTRVYPYFDSVPVSSYCRPAGGSLGSPLMTDIAGVVEGVFEIPNNENIRFRTGEREFKLIDNPTDSNGDSLTTGVATYTAKGTLNTRQETILSTRTVTTHTVNKIVWVDPLAQSFILDQPGGGFLTKIDIYFASKDDVMPVTLELREMVNGYPGQNKFPGSIVTLNPNQVNISNDASVKTTFVFDHPVYIRDGIETCFVLLTNSTKYNVWVGRMGEQIVNTNRFISKQPYAGVMFKSQNASTWTADQTTDIKFEIYRAVFNSGSPGQLTLRNEPVPTYISQQGNPFRTFNGENRVRMYVPNHGMYPGCNFSITGAVAGNGIPANQLNGTRTVTNVIDQNNFEFNVSSNANNNGFMGGFSVIVSRNVMYNTMQTNINALVIPDTDIMYSHVGRYGRAIGGEVNGRTVGNESLPVSFLNEQQVNFSGPMLIQNHTQNSSGTVLINATMTSSRDNISPVIDLYGSTAVFVENIINDPIVITETSATDEGNTVARYINKPAGVSLAANSLKCFVDINKPQGVKVEVYYRTANTEAELKETDWNTLTALNPSPNTDDDNFYENEFGVDGIGDFTVYQIKIVQTSPNSSRVAQFKRLRLLALGT